MECELVTFGKQQRVERDASGLVVRVLSPAMYLHGHPVHPLAFGLLPTLRNADVVHTHHMRSAPSRMAAVGARVMGKRAVVTDHGLGGGGWFGVLPRLFDRFLTVSQYSADLLHARPDRTRVIYGGADPERFAPHRDDPRAGVLFVGRFTPHKGVDRLIRALPEGAKLTLAGSEGHDTQKPESDYPQYLRELAAGRSIRFATNVSDVELPVLYRRARVFVLPSVHQTCYGRHVEISELLGLTVLEAMASGTPVICSRVGGVPEIVTEGVTGFLVEPGNVEQLRERISLLLADKALADRMGRAARESVLERFTWEKCAERCLESYAELA
ncbi:MAG TPA: glycosyltransferase family 4 protein [Propionibacteriaceae bacterium]|nr:glycosyltransferase family 4 protein [Propionibacteriaceae bacterium]